MDNDKLKIYDGHIHTHGKPGDPPFTRVGVINWDCSVPSDTTFFGRYATRSLGPREFRDRTPFYAVETGPDTIQYRERTLAEYETELRHAVAAGIDYFAYCWYDRAPHADHVVGWGAETVDDTVCELAYARLRHLASPLRDRIGLCAILVACHPAPGRQVVRLTLTDPKGAVMDESSLYTLEGGRASIPIRLARNAEKGGLLAKWRILVEDLTTGLAGKATF